jgi:uncharacterized glyoxalase superfamily protein PhnB
MANAKPVPDGFHTLTPHLIVNGGLEAIEFYKRAFGAELVGQPHTTPDGRLTHARLKVGDSVLMLADDFGCGSNGAAAATGGAHKVVLHLYVEDVDALYDRAVKAGATVAMPLMDAFWGDRYGQLTDPYGHTWSLATHIQDLTDEEIQKAQAEAMAKWMKKESTAA